MTNALPADIEEYRDLHWQREDRQRIETVSAAERFIERVGFAQCLIDSRKPGASLYVAVCGRRDAVMPRNVQKDPEASLTWTLKDEMIQRGKVYYAKLRKARTFFLAPRMIPYFHALWGVKKTSEVKELSAEARLVLKVLRKEWELATADLRTATGIADRKTITAALEELQAAMLIVPSEVVYQPKFTYIWTLAAARFPVELKQTIAPATAYQEIARCFLQSAGMTLPGELARITGLSRPSVGLGNRALVQEGFAIAPARGTYLLATLAPTAVTATATTQRDQASHR